MNMQKNLEELLGRINERLKNAYNTEREAQLLIAKANVLLALQKYED